MVVKSEIQIQFYYLIVRAHLRYICTQSNGCKTLKFINICIDIWSMAITRLGFRDIMPGTNSQWDIKPKVKRPGTKYRGHIAAGNKAMVTKYNT